MLNQKAGYIRATATAMALCSLAISAPASASTKGDLKENARKIAADMRAAGAPQNRCNLNTYFNGGHILDDSGALKRGDRLLYLNNQDVSSAKDDDIVAILKGIAPDAQIPVRVEREGAQLDIQVKCSNVADVQNLILSALDLAGKKKVDECAAVLSPIAGRDMQAAAIRYECAAASDDTAKYDMAKFASEVVEDQILRARYEPGFRREAVQNLRGNQGILSASIFDRLVEETKHWPGDETLFEDTKPDWNLYRKNAEIALLSGFFDPGSAIVEWPYGFRYGTWKPVLQARIEGYWTCGMVNGKNRMGGYVGSRYFVVVMGHNANVLFNQVGDGGNYDFVAGACQQSVSLLPAASTQFSSSEARSPSASGAPSIADELAKLAELKASGALTEAEYQAAKAKVLDRN